MNYYHHLTNMKKVFHKNPFNKDDKTEQEKDLVEETDEVKRSYQGTGTISDYYYNRKKDEDYFATPNAHNRPKYGAAPAPLDPNDPLANLDENTNPDSIRLSEPRGGENGVMFKLRPQYDNIVLDDDTKEKQNKITPVDAFDDQTTEETTEPDTSLPDGGLTIDLPSSDIGPTTKSDDTSEHEIALVIDLDDPNIESTEPEASDETDTSNDLRDEQQNEVNSETTDTPKDDQLVLYLDSDFPSETTQPTNTDEEADNTGEETPSADTESSETTQPTNTDEEADNTGEETPSADIETPTTSTEDIEPVDVYDKPEDNTSEETPSTDTETIQEPTNTEEEVDNTGEETPSADTETPTTSTEDTEPVDVYDQLEEEDNTSEETPFTEPTNTTSDDVGMQLNPNGTIHYVPISELRPPTNCSVISTNKTLSNQPIISSYARLNALGSAYGSCAQSHFSCYRTCGITKAYCDDQLISCIKHACISTASTEYTRCDLDWDWGGQQTQTLEIAQSAELLCGTFQTQQSQCHNRHCKICAKNKRCSKHTK
jgi:hypothetical protein